MRPRLFFVGEFLERRRAEAPQEASSAISQTAAAVRPRSVLTCTDWQPPPWDWNNERLATAAAKLRIFTREGASFTLQQLRRE